MPTTPSTIATSPRMNGTQKPTMPQIRLAIAGPLVLLGPCGIGAP
jgi:hypothetical protein